MASHIVLGVLVVLCCSRVWGAETEAWGVEGSDEMLSALEAGGATRAVVCAGGGGCRAALWARYWLLARASCLERLGRPVHGALVLLHRDPEDCAEFVNKPRPVGSLEALTRMLPPGYFRPRPADEDQWWEEPEPAPAPLARDPLDAALVLLASPAPPPTAGNHSYIMALLPELSSWLQYVPAAVPWARAGALGPALGPPPAPEPRLDPARVRWLDSPLRLLVAAALLPTALLLALFTLVMHWPLHSSIHTSQEAKEVLIDCDMRLDDEV